MKPLLSQGLPGQPGSPGPAGKEGPVVSTLVLIVSPVHAKHQQRFKKQRSEL